MVELLPSAGDELGSEQIDGGLHNNLSLPPSLSSPHLRSVIQTISSWP